MMHSGSFFKIMSKRYKWFKEITKLKHANSTCHHEPLGKFEVHLYWSSSGKMVDLMKSILFLGFIEKYSICSGLY